MADTLIKGFPVTIGGKTFSAIDHTGPASYTAVTTGAPVSGGDVIVAATFGLRFIEAVECTMDNTGVYDPDPILSAADAVPRTQITLRWFTAAGRAEVAGATNLSASHVRIQVIGY